VTCIYNNLFWRTNNNLFWRTKLVIKIFIMPSTILPSLSASGYSKFYLLQVVPGIAVCVLYWLTRRIQNPRSSRFWKFGFHSRRWRSRKWSLSSVYIAVFIFCLYWPLTEIYTLASRRKMTTVLLQRKIMYQLLHFSHFHLIGTNSDSVGF
jgi:hypothetical protein